MIAVQLYKDRRDERMGIEDSPLKEGVFGFKFQNVICFDIIEENDERRILVTLQGGIQRMLKFEEQQLEALKTYFSKG